jgi:phosphomannomutase
MDADIAATPTTGVLVRQYAAAGGIQISASHNPAEYNGLKLFAPSGQVLTDNVGQAVRQRFRQAQIAWAAHDAIGRVERCADPVSHHLKLVLATVNVPRIQQRRFHVLLDANHGAGSILGRRLLEELSCRVTVLGERPDGQFEHPPEPTAENLEAVRQRVPTSGAEIGFCQDPDADRLAVIDETGRFLGEEYTLALCLDHVLRSRRGPVVTNCATSRMAQDLAVQHGCPFYRTAVGEAHVVAGMQARQAVFGGEGNGGPIDPRVGYVRDSFVAMALLLDHLAAAREPISRLAARLPRYEIQKSKVTLAADRVADALQQLQQYFGDAAADHLDGLRLDWPAKWLLVRPSNTEPIVRIIAEAPTASEAAALCDETARLLLD